MQRVTERVARGSGAGGPHSLIEALYGNVEARGDEVAFASRVGERYGEEIEGLYS